MDFFHPYLQVLYFMNETSPPLKKFYPDIPRGIHDQIIRSFMLNENKTTYSHKIKGRWENRYLETHYVPEVRVIFQTAESLAKDWTGQSVVVPHMGLGLPMDEFWFNLTKPGESTAWHDHKENAVISGVYYLQIPKDSGDIRFRKKEKEEWVEWEEKSGTGKMILFDSSLEHRVKENKSLKNRVSLAFNLYELPLEITHISDDYSHRNFYG